MAVRSNRRANNERESRGTSPMITASKHISLSFPMALSSLSIKAMKRETILMPK